MSDKTTPTEQDKELRDILGWVLLDGQNQIHDLKNGKATPEQITERMFASLDYWQPKLMQLITAHLQAYTDEIRSEVIGDGEAHISHLCPPDDVGCAKFAARGQMRHEQRQALNTLAAKWGVK